MTKYTRSELDKAAKDALRDAVKAAQYRAGSCKYLGWELYLNGLEHTLIVHYLRPDHTKHQLNVAI